MNVFLQLVGGNLYAGGAHGVTEIPFNTAARIIEVVAGMTYEEFMQQRLLDPLGMKDTTFWPNEKQAQRGEIVSSG